MKIDTPSSSVSTYLLVPILLLFALLIVAVLRSPSLISSAGIGSAMIVAAPLVLATYSLMAVAIAGRGTVDLSVGPLLGFINVTLVQLNDAGVLTSPVAVFLYAIAAGVAYQMLMALIIIFVRVQPIIVSLSGFLALSGINLVIMPRPGGTAPEWMMSWGAGTSILSPALVILAVSTAAWLLLARTAFFGHLRMMGYDERAAYTSGVRIGWVRFGAHCIAGAFAGLAAITVTSLIGSGDPTQGTTYTLIAVTALVLGGTSLAGGRGGVIGSLIGAFNIFLIGYVLATFNFGGVQGFVTEMSYGIILVLSFMLSVALPYIQRLIRHVSPLLLFVVLALIFCGVMLHAKYDYRQHAKVAMEKAPATKGSVSGISAALSAEKRPAIAFFFDERESLSKFTMSNRQMAMALAALLLILLVFFLRVTVREAKARVMTPFMYVSLLILALVVLWLLATSARNDGHPLESGLEPPLKIEQRA